MDLKPQKPIREFRFKLTLRYHNGQEVEKILAGGEETKMNDLIQQMAEFINPEYPVANIFIDVGDQQERWIKPTDEAPLPGLNTLDDIGGPPAAAVA